MARRTKKSIEEKLSPSNLDKVISLLEGDKPITKKTACEILNISYNTTRLNNILQEYKDKKEKDSIRRAEKKGKPPSKEEISHIIESYLEGDTIDSISSSIFRGVAFVKHILEKYGCPIRSRSPDYFHPELIPEEAMREKFKVGDIVYSARYDSLAKIDSEKQYNNTWAYRIWLLSEKQQQFAYQEAAELASLDHLRELGIKV